MSEPSTEFTVEEMVKRLDDILHETRIAISLMVLICILNVMMVGLGFLAWVIFGENAGK